MAVLVVKEPGLAGTLLGAVAAAGGGDSFANDGKTLLYVKNLDSVAKTVTVAAQRACSFGTQTGHDSVTSVAQNEEKLIGPFPQARFSDANGNAQITYSAVTSTTVSPVRMPV